MVRRCDLCDGPISDSAGICPCCGVDYPGADSAEPYILGRPRWGLVRISLPPGADDDPGGATTQAFLAAWQALERGPLMKGAPGKTQRITAPLAGTELLATYWAYLMLAGQFQDRLALVFVDMAPGELQRLRERCETER